MLQIHSVMKNTPSGQKMSINSMPGLYKNFVGCLQWSENGLFCSKTTPKCKNSAMGSYSLVNCQ